jgi:hypothetical protein
VRLLNVALKYFPDDATLAADLLEMQAEKWNPFWDDNVKA